MRRLGEDTMRSKPGWLLIIGLTLQAHCAPGGEGPARAPDQNRQPRAAKTPDRARQEGEAFLAENARKRGVVTLPSGLQYQVLRPGKGKTPQDGDKVVCHYRGSFVDGRVFDDSYARSRPGTFELARMTPGFREAMKLMPVGSKWQIVIPAALAYGDQGMPTRKKARSKIGPNTTLVFETELLAILPGGTPPKTAAVWTPPPEN